MTTPDYHSQVRLLLMVLPFVAEEECFALKGGTAINLFYRDFPRLSVDIDLTYLPAQDRKTALAGIADGLSRIKLALEKNIEGIVVTMLPQSDGQEAKILCRLDRAEIKVEVNTTIRGFLWKPEVMPVADAVQDEFGLFAAIKVVSKGELYGGKICAALDRQHPRDLFDVLHLFREEGITEEIRLGFIAALAGHNRPMQELLHPNFQDQRQVFESQFDGMSQHPFSYEDFEATRVRLVQEINSSLTEQDRAFLVSLKEGEPDWSLFPVAGIEKMSAIQWRLFNIRKLRDKNPSKHAKLLAGLMSALDSRA